MVKNTGPSLESILEESFLNYSAFVLQRRAIPDVRDGMKYTARQILHAQQKDKLDYKHPFKKSQKSVAAATSFSYVHGDTSCYEQIVRMGRNLVQRYHMEEFHGNNGTPCSSDDYSAPRYTEARLSPLALRCFEHLNEGVLDQSDWSPTYDEEGEFPLVLPSLGFYGMCNGSFGSIGVGLISSIPQFNLIEMNEAIIKLIFDENAEVDLLPDFSSGGVLLNPKTTALSLANGEGKSAILSGSIRKSPKGDYIEIIELPYGVYTNTVCVELEKALEKGKPPFKSYKDLSKKSVCIRIYTDTPKECENWLYKNTSFKKYFTIKLIMLRDGKRPMKFTLKEAILEHVRHVKKVYTRHFEHELQVLKNRAEIIMGFLGLQSILDEVIAAIRATEGGKAAVIAMLRHDFDFTELQANAIAERRLHQLSSFDILALKKELDENTKQQRDIGLILKNKEQFNEKLAAIYREVADTYGDARRTRIVTTDEWESSVSGKVEKDAYCYFSAEKAIISYLRDDEDFSGVDGVEITSRRLDDTICIITSSLRAFSRELGEFSIGVSNWGEVINLKDGERVIGVYSKSELDALSRVVFTLGNGSEKTVHPSFVTAAASKRGKLIFSGKVNATDMAVIE